MAVRAVGNTLTGQTSLASTPCNWHPYWFYNLDEPLTDNTGHHFTDEDFRRRQKLQLHFKENTTLHPPFNEKDASSVFLLQFTNQYVKLLNPDGCSSKNTECRPPSKQRLRRHYSILHIENCTNCSQCISYIHHVYTLDSGAVLYYNRNNRSLSSVFYWVGYSERYR